MDATTANIVYPNASLALVAGRHGVFIVNRNDIYIGAALELYSPKVTIPPVPLGKPVDLGGQFRKSG